MTRAFRPFRDRLPVPVVAAVLAAGLTCASYGPFRSHVRRKEAVAQLDLRIERAQRQQQAETSFRLTLDPFWCRIGGNAGDEVHHRRGYNGLWSLVPAGQNESAVFPELAALNLEHFFNGRDEFTDSAKLFEPRTWPMALRHRGGVVELHQSPTRFFEIESWTRFRKSQGRYLDVEFEAVPHRDVFPSDWLGFFWASYMAAPDDIEISFLGYRTSGDRTPEWIKTSGGMYYGRNAAVPLPVRKTQDHAMYRAGEIRWAEPFYYGLWRDRAYVVMFDTPHDVAFYSGGQRSGAWHPWDFQMIVRDPQVGARYRLKMRLLFEKFQGRDWVRNEYQKWRKSL